MGEHPNIEKLPPNLREILDTPDGTCPVQAATYVLEVVSATGVQLAYFAAATPIPVPLAGVAVQIHSVNVVVTRIHHSYKNDSDGSLYVHTELEVEAL